MLSITIVSSCARAITDSIRAAKQDISIRFIFTDTSFYYVCKTVPPAHRYEKQTGRGFPVLFDTLINEIYFSFVLVFILPSSSRSTALYFASSVFTFTLLSSSFTLPSEVFSFALLSPSTCSLLSSIRQSSPSWIRELFTFWPLALWKVS